MRGYACRGAGGFSTYLNVSKEVRKIYEDYTERIEAYGIDECWLDVTSGVKLFGGGREIAEAIRERIKNEIGLTVSIGVSWNKIFAKLGSDMKKPDAVTEITPDNYKEKIWTLPVEDLLYVGFATKHKLNRIGIKTIGQLAQTDEKILTDLLGKWGSYIHTFANGKDESPVLTVNEEEAIKSIGNSLTVYRDLKNEDDVEMVIWLLADSVASRMREAALNMQDIAKLAFKLFKEVYPWKEYIRSMGVYVTDFITGDKQLDMFGNIEKDEKQKRLDNAIDKLRKKYGNNIIQSAVVFKDPKLRDLVGYKGRTRNSSV